jgi:hypothetical protein
MTFKVEQITGYYKYKISIGTGRTFKAMNLEQVAYGLQHYFCEDLFDNKYNYQKHMKHAKECDYCPLCRR